MEHGGDAFTLWARKRDLTVEINRILYQLIIGVSFFWWLFHNREYRATSSLWLYILEAKAYHLEQLFCIVKIIL